MPEWKPLLLEGKNALVTGAGGRIGSQIVAVMGREGASVAALDLTQELADRGAGASPGNAVALTADVTSADEADAAVAMAENEIGPLDILVNSHGIFPTITLLDLTPEKWDNIFAVNVRGNVLMCQAVARRWIKQQPGLDRKYQLRRRDLRACRRRRLLRVQSRAQHDDEGPGHRARPPQHQGQRSVTPAWSSTPS